MKRDESATPCAHTQEEHIDTRDEIAVQGHENLYHDLLDEFKEIPRLRKADLDRWAVVKCDASASRAWRVGMKAKACWRGMQTADTRASWSGGHNQDRHEAAGPTS